jgi:hypothetical protein
MKQNQNALEKSTNAIFGEALLVALFLSVALRSSRTNCRSNTKARKRLDAKDVTVILIIKWHEEVTTIRRPCLLFCHLRGYCQSSEVASPSRFQHPKTYGLARTLRTLTLGYKRWDLQFTFSFTNAKDSSKSYAGNSCLVAPGCNRNKKVQDITQSKAAFYQVNNLCVQSERPSLRVRILLRPPTLF